MRGEEGISQKCDSEWNVPKLYMGEDVAIRYIHSGKESPRDNIPNLPKLKAGGPHNTPNRIYHSAAATCYRYNHSGIKPSAPVPGLPKVWGEPRNSLNGMYLNSKGRTFPHTRRAVNCPGQLPRGQLPRKTVNCPPQTTGPRSTAPRSTVPEKLAACNFQSGQLPRGQLPRGQLPRGQLPRGS